MSLLPFFRKLETIPALKAALLVGLGGALVLSCGAVLWDSPGKAFSLDVEYLRAHGHDTQLWLGFVMGAVLVACGLKRFFK